MTASAQLASQPALSPEYHSPKNTTEEQRIRVKNTIADGYEINIKDTPGGYSMYPHYLVLDLIELTGKKSNVFVYVWERTIAHWWFTEEIAMSDFTKRCKCSERTVQAAVKWLVENGWLEIIERPGMRTIYGVPLTFLKKYGLLERYGHPENEEVAGVAEFSGEPTPKAAGVEAPVSILSLKERKEERTIPKPDQPVDSTGGKNDANSDQVSGSGTYLKIHTGGKDLEMVREMVRFDVNRAVVMKAIADKGEKWVRKIYREFNDHINTRHNMKNPPAVLAARLQDYEESWRTVAKKFPANKPPGSRDADTWKMYLDKNIVEKFQEIVYKQYDDPRGDRAYLWEVLLDFRNEANITLEQAFEVLDLRGASREEIHTWWNESREVS